MKAKILVVDDEPDAVELVGFNLKAAGFTIITAETGREALAKVREQNLDLIILDVMLPEMDGLEVCKNLRREPVTAAIPILMLTAKAAEIDRVLGLEFGADDYLTKPFSPRELVLRVKNLLRRRQVDGFQNDCIMVGALSIDIPRHLVAVNGNAVALTATEFKLLAMLAQRRGRVQSRELLLQEVWGYDSSTDTRTIDTHMSQLRDKLGTAGQYLDTVRNVGYRFAEESA